MAGNQFFFDTSVYTKRREVLSKSIKKGQILLLGNSFSPMNYKDNYYPFRQDSSFIYYIGINLPDLCAIIDLDKNKTTLYGDDVTIDMIIWTGNQPSLSSLGSKVGIKKVKPLSALKNDLKKKVHYFPPYRSQHAELLKDLLGTKKIKPSKKLISAAVAQRNKKSSEEIEQLEKAVFLTSRMHDHVMLNAKRGMKEYELVGLASKFAFENNARFSFPPICTTNGQTLHNHYYGNTLKSSDTILFDSGLEIESTYCGDMTRCFPVGKRFSSIQKQLYKIVAEAHDVAVEHSKPGVHYKDVHLHSSRAIAKGLIEMGWMKGDPDEAVSQGAHSLFFQHGLGHMMGLDVHDMENLGEDKVGYDSTVKRSKQFGLRSLRLGKALEENYVITIEPGLYVIPELIDKFQGEKLFKDFINYDVVNKHRDAGGYRIENDYVVEESGVRALGEPMDFDVETVERFRK